MSTAIADVRRRVAGFSLVELMFAVSIACTLTAIAVPQVSEGLEDYRTRAAARYVAMRIGQARFAAITRSTHVGLQFEAAGADYRFAAVVDGNGNGLRISDVQHGDDPVVAPPELLAWNFSGVSFGLLSGVPDADGHANSSADGVRIGASTLLSMNPNGSSSGGTLYVRGRTHAQYAVRVLGATGRVRVLRYDPIRRTWTES